MTRRLRLIQIFAVMTLMCVTLAALRGMSVLQARPDLQFVIVVGLGSCLAYGTEFALNARPKD